MHPWVSFDIGFGIPSEPTKDVLNGAQTNVLQGRPLPCPYGYRRTWLLTAGFRIVLHGTLCPSPLIWRFQPVGGVWLFAVSPSKIFLTIKAMTFSFVGNLSRGSGFACYFANITSWLGERGLSLQKGSAKRCGSLRSCSIWFYRSFPGHFYGAGAAFCTVTLLFLLGVCS